jgi:hypothetical protein
VLQNHGNSSLQPRTTLTSERAGSNRHKNPLRRSESVYPQELFQDSDSLVQAVVSQFSKSRLSSDRKRIDFNYASFE